MGRPWRKSNMSIVSAIYRWVFLIFLILSLALVSRQIMNYFTDTWQDLIIFSLEHVRLYYRRIRCPTSETSSFRFPLIQRNSYKPLTGQDQFWNLTLHPGRIYRRRVMWCSNLNISSKNILMHRFAFQATCDAFITQPITQHWFSMVRHHLTDDWAFANETEKRHWEYPESENELKEVCIRFNTIFSNTNCEWTPKGDLIDDTEVS